uniref:Peptidase M48 domain-containing protein n=1 Tax=Rheinheimera sp. BAL341 TaxID=1708203 RepID=A0A486XUN0_9GAMM
MNARILLLLLVCANLHGCKMTAGGVDIGAITQIGANLSQLGGIKQPQELALGDDFAAMLLGASRLHPNTALQHYVNSVGRYLASHSNRPDLPWTFGILDTPDLNAFAIPGGYVFITSGLLANLQSEAELAAVLAHEISHINQRHHLQQLERDNSINFISNLASTALTYHDQRNPGGSKNEYRNRQIAESVLNAGHQLYSKGLSRDDELEADTLAIRLAARAGYDPYAMATVLQQLESISADSNAISLMLATHPAASERLNHIEQQLDKLEQRYPSVGADKLNLQQRYLAALSKK